MGAKRRRIEAGVKAKVALAAARGDRTTSGLVSQFGVHGTQIGQWKRRLLDGRGRWMDNVFVERLWRTLKYEYLYPHDYATPRALQAGLAEDIPDYNEERIHAALDYRTPWAVYCKAA